MDRDEYIEALTFCFKAEAAGAAMGDVVCKQAQLRQTP